MAKKRSIVSSFCYQIDDMSIIEEAERLASQDRVSFSDWLVRTIKEKVREEKNEKPQENFSPLRNCSANLPIHEEVNESLQKWMPKIRDPKTANLIINNIKGFEGHCYNLIRNGRIVSWKRSFGI